MRKKQTTSYETRYFECLTKDKGDSEYDINLNADKPDIHRNSKPHQLNFEQYELQKNKPQPLKRGHTSYIRPMILNI